MSGRRHARQLALFLVVGGAQLLLDSALFVGLSAAGVAVAMSNIAGRVAGAALGFWLNGRYTFAYGGPPRLARRHLLRFLCAWLALTAISTAALHAIAGASSLQWAWLAKPAVEAVMAAVGFVIWRQWVYR